MLRILTGSAQHYRWVSHAFCKQALHQMDHLTVNHPLIIDQPWGVDTRVSWTCLSLSEPDRWAFQ